MWAYLLSYLLGHLRFFKNIQLPNIRLPKQDNLITVARPIDFADVDIAPDLSISTSSSSPDTSPSTPPTDIFALYFEENGCLHSTSPVEDNYILVIGGLGYIGSHTTLELLKAGYNVLVVDNLSNSYHSVYNRIRELASRHHAGTKKRMPSFHFHKFDYRDTFALRSLLDAYTSREGTVCPWKTLDANNNNNTPSEGAHVTPSHAKSRIIGTIHFAAHKAVAESISSPLPYYSNNVSG